MSTTIRPVQLAYFVSDIREAAFRCAKVFGAGPFYLLERIELAWGEHRGRPCDFVHSSAYGQWGDLMLELVQQDDEGPSPFRDRFAPGVEGLHHVASFVESLDEAIDTYHNAGIALATRAATRRGGSEFAFLDTTATMGHMLEVYETTPSLVAFYAHVREAAREWDGSDPVREL